MVEEVQKYVATLGNVPEEDKDFLKARSCMVTISVGQEAHEDEKFRATMKMVSLRFKKCIISVNDELQRYTIAAKDPLQRSPEEFNEYSKQLGDEWLERNLATIKKELKIPYKIMRWDEYLNNPKFQDCYKEVIDLFKNNHEYQAVIKNTARDFLTRSSNTLNINISPERFCKLSEEYLLEECTAFLQWIDHKYDYELYPSVIGSFIKKTFDLLRPEESQNIAHRLKIKFEKIAKEKEFVLENKVGITLENIMEIAPENIFWKNKYGAILGCNRSHAKRLNYKNINKIIGQTDFDFYDLEKAMEIRKNDLYVMKSNKKLIIEENIEVDGKWKYYLSYKQPLRDKYNNSIGIVGVSVDITKQKQLEQELIIKNEALEAALAAKTQFLNNISHEIRTPVQGFVNMSQAAYEDWGSFSDREKHELLEKVFISASRLSSMVCSLLDLAKFTQGKMIMFPSDCELKQIIKEIIEECKFLYLTDKKIDIIFDFDGSIPLHVDKKRITQLLRNLIFNAIKFSDENTTIVIKLLPSELTYEDGSVKKSLHCIISDQGKGVPENELEAIFEPFTQSTRTNTKAGGTGLGLAICREIVTSHHGKIWAENNENVGSRFHFIIPLSLNKEEGEKITTSYRDERPENNLCNGYILVVDDESYILNMLEMMLVSGNYQTLKAQNAEKGLVILKEYQNKIKLVMLDYMMSGIDGLGFLKKMKEDENLKKIPVILQSGTNEEKVLNDAWAIGIAGFLPKPYNRTQVLEEVDKILKK